MFNYGSNKKMQKRPENEPKFSLKNKTDRMILLFILLGILVFGGLLALFIVLYYLRWNTQSI